MPRWSLIYLVSRAISALQAPPPQGDVLKRALSASGTVSAKVVDCSGLVGEICRLQECSPLASTALGRALTSAILVADGIQDEELFQVHFDGDGPLRGVFASANGRLETRGYVGNPKVSLDVSVSAGVGSGQLKVVRLKNLPGEDYSRPFSSIVSLVSGEIAEDVNHYMATSEQREGALAAGVSVDPVRAAGWRVELLPGATDEDAAVVAGNIGRLADRESTHSRIENDGPDDLLNRLLEGLEPRILDDVSTPTFKCTCSEEKVYKTLALLPRDEVERIIQENECIQAKCEFCATLYELTPNDITAHLKKVDDGTVTYEGSVM